ncbi:MAG: hypothetical protein H3C28_08375 [Sphingomonadales bacterium]|nr:hypothetical protein [Sphingomonadales bacterium]
MLEHVEELRPDIKERLKHLLHTQDTVSAGQLVLLGLDDMKARLGDDWPRYADRVHSLLHKVFTNTLLPSEVFLRLGDDRYVVVFHERDQAAARLVCEKMVQNVYEIFLGTPHFSKMALDSVVMTLDSTTLARSLGVGLSESIAGDVQTTFMDKLSPVRLAREEAGGLPLREICYIPMWDIAHRIVYAYQPTIFKLSGRRRLSGYAALSNQKNPTLVHEFDAALYKTAVADLEAVAGAKRPVLGVVPVSYLTLSGVGSSVDYYRLCMGHGAKVARNLIFEAAHFNAGTPPWRAYEIVSMLKQFSRGVFVRIDASWRNLELLGDLQLLGITLDLELDARPIAQIRADIERVAAYAKKHRLLLAVAGVHSPMTAYAAAEAGARFVSGHYLVAATAKPQPALSLDWLDFSHLESQPQRPVASLAVNG